MIILSYNYNNLFHIVQNFHRHTALIRLNSGYLRITHYDRFSIEHALYI
jgi:hypothetical protein